MILYESKVLLGPLISTFTGSLPKSILMIYNGEKEYVQTIQQELREKGIIAKWEAVCFKENGIELFNEVYGKKEMNRLETLKTYDIVLLASIVEEVEEKIYMKWIESLLGHVSQYVCVIQNLFHNVREYMYPLMFCKYNYHFLDSVDRILRIHFFKNKYVSSPVDLDYYEVQKKCRRKLKLAYFMGHSKLTGTTKLFIEQIKQLQKRGHEIIIYAREPIPNWWALDMSLGKLKIVSVASYTEENIDKDIDLIIVFAEGNLSIKHIPIVLWEHSSRWLFGEYKDLKQYNIRIKAYNERYTKRIYMLTVSNLISEIIKARYGRYVRVLPGSINNELYYSKSIPPHKLRILLVGDNKTRYKRFDRCIRALDYLKAAGVDFEVIWMTQTSQELVEREYIKYIISPTQEILQTQYRTADILLSASDFESFTMPTLEAMASGVSVVAMNNGGIMLYARNGENMILCEQREEDKFNKALLEVATNVKLREKLIKEGKKTALEYDSKRIAEMAEIYFYSICEDWKKRNNKA